MPQQKPGKNFVAALLRDAKTPTDLVLALAELERRFTRLAAAWENAKLAKSGAEFSLPRKRVLAQARQLRLGFNLVFFPFGESFFFCR